MRDVEDNKAIADRKDPEDIEVTCAPGHEPEISSGEEAAEAIVPAKPKRVLKIAAIGAGLALVAAIGAGGAWAAGAFSGGEAPEAVRDAAASIRAAVGNEARVPIGAEADGWSDSCGRFGFAVVDEEGEVAEEGELSPGEDAEVTLPDGVYAVSITSIPTRDDGKTTWSLPASQMLQVEDGRAAPSEINFTLLPVDPADGEAVEAVTASLPEGEREAARALLTAKREDPSAEKVESAPARPRPAPGPGGPSGPDSGSGPSGSSEPPKKWGVVKEAWDERVLVSAAWDETVVVKEAWTENKLVRAAWTETINHPAEYRTEMVRVGTQYICDDCGYSTTDRNAIVNHGASNGHVNWAKPIYEERQVLVKDAWTETVNHPAEYQTVNHPAETKTVHHDAVYKTVHHDAVYGWI